MATDLSQSSTRTYTGENLRAVAMPLGGIGTGTIALAGDGSLRQWQIHNQINHLACVPQSFFAVRAQAGDGPAVTRVLQSTELYDDNTPEPPPPPTSNDHVIPLSHRRLMQKLPGVESTTFSGTYPIANVNYHDPELPVQISLEAFNPFVPLNSKDSGLPTIIFNFTLTNTSGKSVAASVAGSLQNSIGWDGVAPIFDTRCQFYGGNRNTVAHQNDATSILMSAVGQDDAHPGFGTMALTAYSANTSAAAQWSDLTAMWNDFSADGHFSDEAGSEPSKAGRTWNGALAIPIELAPGQSRTVTFSISWHFPNRYVDQAQAGLLGLEDSERLHRIGNKYSTWFKSADDVAEYVGENLESLSAQTRTARDTFQDTTLPPALIDSVTSQMSIIRSPTCFWTEDGHFYGYEGCNGASTLHHTLPYGGCCPLNCTHVWNYEMSLARLFPELERSMREVEWDVQQHPTGYLPHRVVLPLDQPRPWDRSLGGPDKPALDGLLGAVLKTYREHRANGDTDWLRQYWPSIVHALDHIWTEHDPELSGVIRGEQPNTYDISIFGANTFIGTLYLATLRAVEQMAGQLDEPGIADKCRGAYERGSTWLDDHLWNGDYYIQDVDLNQFAEQNWATGCHADQLLGQWWADALDLGDLLDPERLATTARSIVENNFRTSFPDRPVVEREYVTPEDQGLIVCTWPRGGRPEVPTRYSDEVWTGLEYEVASLLLQRGETGLAMQILEATRARHDGRKQNPWNDIECGDHYVRAMASWALLETATGYQYNASSDEIRFAPVFDASDFRAPFVARDGWGSYWVNNQGGTPEHGLALRHGTLAVNCLHLQSPTQPQHVEITIDGSPIPAAFSAQPGEVSLEFAEPVRIEAGQHLRIVLT